MAHKMLETRLFISTQFHTSFVGDEISDSLNTSGLVSIGLASNLSDLVESLSTKITNSKKMMFNYKRSTRVNCQKSKQIFSTGSS